MRSTFEAQKIKIRIIDFFNPMNSFFYFKIKFTEKNERIYKKLCVHITIKNILKFLHKKNIRNIII